ncbi:hypothetical protein [Psychrobacter sp. DAB_AL62B]|uniref:hypothetical protein n=1 Tax=Psychrobacter sp. DAB_AL62B TaxID=1028420 RepID=UPI002380D5D3|nr:hypothetical protein [Psychrobacter sp. DAB_AL62B]MDE4455896.1 hypothetical protein [Psychrobacter sp. DAB_AL62B]
MYPKIVELDIKHEIDGFERATLTRLLNSFEDIELEATEKRRKFLERKSKNFDPDIDDEADIEEDAYFKEISHLSIEQELRQEFVNSTAVWLFHMFERQKKRIFKSDQTNTLKPMLAKKNYNIDACPDWKILHKELRNAANAIKHGPGSSAAKQLYKIAPNLFINKSIILSETDIQRYIDSLRTFWTKALKD